MSLESLISQGNTKAPKFAGPFGVFEGRMQRDSATQFSLQRYKGFQIEVNGESVDPGSGGLPRLVSDNLIAADGTDSGGAMAPSTLYYVYVSNSQASFSASSIRASATAPSLFNGVYYLATAGNGANWRFVGWLRTNATGANGNVEDSDTNRFVANYYNRRQSRIYLTPGYVNGAGLTSYTLGPTNWAPIHGGTGDQGSYIANGEDSVDVEVTCSLASQTGVDTQVGFGDNTTTSASVGGLNRGTNDNAASCRYVVQQPAVGVRTLNLLGQNSGAGNSTIYASGPQAGGTSPALTYLSALVWV